MSDNGPEGRTPFYDLALPVDGQKPWGELMREALAIIDSRLVAVSGSIFVDNNSTVTPSPGTTGAKALFDEGAVQAGPPCQFCATDGNRITYNGPATKRVTVVATGNLVGPASSTLGWQVRINGAVDGGLAKRMRLNTGQTIGFVAVAGNVDLEPGDFLELWVTNLTNADDVRVLDLTLATRG